MLRTAEPTESKERTLRKHASREQKQEKIALPPEQRPLPYPQPFPEWVSVMHFRWQARSLEDRISHNSARVHRTFSWSVLILCDPHNSSYRRSGHDLAPFFQMWGHRWGDAAPPPPPSRPAPPSRGRGGECRAWEVPRQRSDFRPRSFSLCPASSTKSGNTDVIKAAFRFQNKIKQTSQVPSLL